MNFSIYEQARNLRRNDWSKNAELVKCGLREKDVEDARRVKK